MSQVGSTAEPCPAQQPPLPARMPPTPSLPGPAPVSDASDVPNAVLETPATLGVKPLPKADYWTETCKHWIRIHVMPRLKCFVPSDALDGPSPDALEPTRTSEQLFLNGTRDVKQHLWTNIHDAAAKSRMKWTGRSTFLKKHVAFDKTSLL